MKKLTFLFILLTGKLLAQTPPMQTWPLYTVNGTVQNREGEKIAGYKLKLQIGGDTMLAITDTAGRFSFYNVKSPKFFISYFGQGYESFATNYYNDGKLAQITLAPAILGVLPPVKKVPILTHWDIGDKIDAGAPDDLFHQAVILSEKGDSVKVHFLDVVYPDNWVNKRITRPYNLQFKADSAAAADGLRPGKYVIYIYHSDVGYYQGYFKIYDNGTYQLVVDDHKPSLNQHKLLTANGQGEYSFDKKTGFIKWLSGPFLNLDGKAHLSVSIDGQAYTIQSLTADFLGAGWYSKR